MEKRARALEDWHQHRLKLRSGHEDNSKQLVQRAKGHQPIRCPRLCPPVVENRTGTEVDEEAKVKTYTDLPMPEQAELVEQPLHERSRESGDELVTFDTPF
jgi:hypothetical protein